MRIKKFNNYINESNQFDFDMEINHLMESLKDYASISLADTKFQDSDTYQYDDIKDFKGGKDLFKYIEMHISIEMFVHILSSPEWEPGVSRTIGGLFEDMENLNSISETIKSFMDRHENDINVDIYYNPEGISLTIIDKNNIKL